MSDDLMAQGAARLIRGVEELGADWVVAAVTRIIDLWGRLDASTRAAAITSARVAGDEAAARVAAELRVLFALDVGAQRTTPLEILRSLRREATAVLVAADVPPIVRDAYEVRAFPDDLYGIVLKSPADLARDETSQAELGGALLAWGLGKAKILRERADQDAQG